MLTTPTEEAKKYAKQLKEEIGDLSDAEKISHLLERVKYWYGSSQDWRKFYEAEKEKANK